MDVIEAENDIEKMLWAAEMCVDKANEECRIACELYNYNNQKRIMYSTLIQNLKNIQELESKRKRKRVEHDEDDEIVPTQPSHILNK